MLEECPGKPPTPLSSFPPTLLLSHISLLLQYFLGGITLAIAAPQLLLSILNMPPFLFCYFWITKMNAFLLVVLTPPPNQICPHYICFLRLSHLCYYGTFVTLRNCTYFFFSSLTPLYLLCQLLTSMKLTLLFIRIHIVLSVIQYCNTLWFIGFYQYLIALT